MSLNEIKLQREFTREHVLHNISGLISMVLESCSGHGKMIEILSGLIEKEDWETPAKDAGYSVAKMVDESYYWVSSLDPMDASRESYQTKEEAYEACCRSRLIEPGRIPAMQHYIVTPALADWLKAEGEMVSSELGGIPIWGCQSHVSQVHFDPAIRRILAKRTELFSNWNDVSF